MSSAVRGVEALFPLLLTVSLRSTSPPSLGNFGTELARFLLPSAYSLSWVCCGLLALLAGNGKEHLGLSLRALAPFLRRSRSFFFLCNAAAERVHQVRNILRPRGGTLVRYRQAGLLLLEHSDDGFLIVIYKLRGVEVRRLALEDVLGQLEHSRLDIHVRNVVEIFLRVPDLVGLAQRGGRQPLVPGLEHDDPLALCQHDTTERNHALAAHGLADHRKCILPD